MTNSDFVDKVEIFHTAGDINSQSGWYWRAIAGNNKLVAIGGEPFDTSNNAKISVKQLFPDLDETKIEVL